MVVFEFGGARRSGVLCRVPLYQAMYSTVARRALVLVGQGRVSVSSPLERGEERFGQGVVLAHYGLPAT